MLTACPGCAMPRLREVPFRRISRPAWPRDEIAAWRDAAWCDRRGDA
jgi:hypothetical protein